MRNLCSSILLAIGVCTTIPSWANDSCPPLTMVASVPMQIGADGRIYVSGKVSGVTKSMLVDTGGVFTELTESAVDELKLGSRHTNLQLIGVAGDTTRLAVRTDFTLGNLRAESLDFMVMPSVHQFAPDVADAAGILGPNLLQAYDLDLDFAGRKLNLISQKHCDGKGYLLACGSCRGRAL